MKIIGVIPARFASTRFPGKPLEKLKGKPILQWVVEGARKSQLLSDLYVATDNQQIAEVAKSIGVNVAMTSPDCATGTDRIFEAIKNIEVDVVINIQGDEPLIDQSYIDPLAQAFLDEPRLDMATLAHGLAIEDFDNKNAVKVITNIHQEAIYFSRFPIPYSRAEFNQPSVALKHIGLYGYSRAFLQKFCTAEPALIEKYESLEQLRALYLGARIKVLQVQKPTYGVDTPEDLQKLEALLG
ncbi:3-deoxy-manno-octulosonate cytidylyltransferase [Pseudobdellovibrio exovorus]|uniref:3-deoxy-manno-octulosonate cytidylyltransferase n=1 Tax=Pseudobdellovibrio exovorus JSS TaxID=1184267 RepID=M4VA92_9BACT|nr:3-deoxy-manno-octulosonate cytidylyltransferase [Pseudobdellovibrio exovorus]AGH94941.1 3-deoxy-manno-octulosonate cytidylyltransferase [Pseudobdellovibrio exovorus JSS]